MRDKINISVASVRDKINISVPSVRDSKRENFMRNFAKMFSAVLSALFVFSSTALADDPALDDENTAMITVWYDDYGISVENAHQLFAATFALTVASGTPVFEGVNNFSIVTPAAIYEDDLWYVTLDYIGDEEDGFTSDGVEDILWISDATGVEIKGALLIGFDENGEEVHFDYGFGENKPPVVSVKYDLNEDDEIDLLDLVIALNYYKVESTDDNWEEAKFVDFNGDGKVNSSDFVFLLNKIAW